MVSELISLVGLVFRPLILAIILRLALLLVGLHSLNDLLSLYIHKAFGGRVFPSEDKSFQTCFQ